MTYIDFNKLLFTDYDTEIKDYNNFSISFDIETYQNGNLFLIANSNKEWLWKPSLKQIFELLLKYENYHITFFNIQFDIDSIIKMFPYQNMIEYRQYQKTNIDEYTFQRVGKKVYSIKKNNHIVNLCDISPFYMTSLNYSSKKYLSMEKHEINIKDLSEEQAENNKQKIIEYCIQDCILTQKLTQRYLELLKKYDLYPRKMVSPAYLSQLYVRKKTQIIEMKWLINNKLKEVIKYAYYSYYGGRFEILNRGIINKKFYSYDINSAYPYEMTKLIDFRKGIWKKTTKPLLELDHGFVKIKKLVLNYHHIQPISYRTKSGLVVYPEGMFKNIYLTIKELKWMLQNDYVYYIEYDSSWNFLPTTIEYPLKKCIQELYDLRLQQKNNKSQEEQVTKIILNSIYGKFLQKVKQLNHYKTGLLFNPLWASEITAGTRLQLLEATKKDQENIIAFATDSITTTKPLNLQISQTELGKWKEEIYDQGVFIMSGVYTMKKNDYYKSATRGFQKTEENNNHESINWFKILEQFKNQNKIIIQKIRPQHFPECFIQDRLGDINKFMPVIKEIDINNDIKRLWINKNKNIEEFMNSWQTSLPIPSEILV